MQRMSFRLAPLAAALLFGICMSFVSCGAKDQGKSFAFVTNGADPFWDIAARGALDAGKELGVKVRVLIPTKGITEQTQMLEDLITQGVAGVAVSPIAPENQTALLDKVAESSVLITHDSDAPDSQRQCYIGADNYKAGRMCGKLVKSSCPDGGKVMLFIGRLEQANARLRRQGVIDELLGYTFDPERSTPVDEATTVGSWTVLGTLTDQFDRPRAKANCEDTLTKHADLACVVGLFAYNAPACLEAVRASRRLGDVKIVAFDEDQRTLQGIIDGEIEGTIVQDPYGYGHDSVHMLAKLASGDRTALPANGVKFLPVRRITRSEVEAYWTKLKQLLAKK